MVDGEPEFVTGARSGRLGELEQRARWRAASWRSSGVVDGVDVPVRPPASSRLLIHYLEPHRAATLPPPVAEQQYRALRRAGLRVLRRFQGADLLDVVARVDRLESYTKVLAEELAQTLDRLDVELAEVRARVGTLEDGDLPVTSGPPATSPSPTAP